MLNSTLRMTLPTFLVAATMMSVVAQDYKGNKFKGSVQAVGDNALAIFEEDAEEPVSFLVSPSVKVSRDGRPVPFNSLQLEDIVIVTAEWKGNRLVATDIFAMEPL